MKRQNRKIIIMAFSLAVLMSCGNKQSQKEKSQHSTSELISQMDSDNDGKLSKTEVKGPLQNDFSKIDTNDDGFISKEELEKAPKPGQNKKVGNQQIKINGVEFTVSAAYQFFSWDNLPDDVELERQPIKTFTNTNGDTHYYEAIYNKNGNLNWFQATKLAENKGGYLACITSKEENDFVFSLVDDEKYFWRFPKYEEGSGHPNHYEIMIGPFLGGYQPEGSEEPAGGWTWISGEKMTYKNWAKNLDDGVTDKDPRPNDQPNDSGDGQNQRIMGFGEMNIPVSTWGDYMDNVGTYGEERLPGRCYGFIIEYDKVLPKQ